MPSRSKTRLTAGEKADFLRRNYGHLGVLSRRANLQAVLELEDRAVQQWVDIRRQCRTDLEQFYAFEYEHSLSLERMFFGLSDEKKLDSYRGVMWQKLELTSRRSLHDWKKYSKHMEAHLAREQAESAAIKHDCCASSALQSARQWAAATRQFECEMALLKVHLCQSCSEIRIIRSGEEKPVCEHCLKTGGGESSQGVAMYSAMNRAALPARPGIFAQMTPDEEAALSPALPYMRVTNASKTSRGAAYGHAFVVTQDVGQLIQALPRLPVEMTSVVLRGDGRLPSLDVNVMRLLRGIQEFDKDPIMRRIMARHGVNICGAEVDARLQEWEQHTCTVPGPGLTTRPVSAGEDCSDLETESEDETEECTMGQHDRGAWADSSSTSGGYEDTTDHSASNTVMQSTNAMQADAEEPEDMQQRPFFSMVDKKETEPNFSQNFQAAVENIEGPALCRPVRDTSRLVRDNSEDLFALSFPTLWFGEADFNFSLWPRPKDFPSRSRWLEHLVNFADGRFAAHHLYVFAAQNWVQRHEIYKSSAIYLKTAASANISLPDLKTAVEEGNFSVLHGVYAFSKTIPGSVPYWRNVRERVKEFVRWKWFHQVATESSSGHWFFDVSSCVHELELSSEELELVAEVGDSDMVHAAVRSEHELHSSCVQGEEGVSDQRLIDGVCNAVRIFAMSSEDIYSAVLDTDLDDDWLRYTASRALQFQACKRSDNLIAAARAAFVLGRVVYLSQLAAQNMPVARHWQCKWREEYQGHIDDALIEPYISSGGVEAKYNSGEPEGVERHEFTFAQQFRQYAAGETCRFNPSFFITGSMAEHHWEDLWAIMHQYVKLIPSDGDEWLAHVQEEGFSRSSDRSLALKRYPHISTTLFRKRTELLYECVLIPVLGVCDHFLKFEFAEGRGEIHFHSLNYSDKYPVGQWVEAGNEREVVRFARSHLRLSAIHPGQSSSQRAYNAYFNPGGQKPNFRNSVHPCKQSLAWMASDKVQQWDIDMCNACFVHDCANNRYCLRKRKSQVKGDSAKQKGVPGDLCHTCRFGYHANNWRGLDIVSCEQAGVYKDSKGSATLVMERDDFRLVQHSVYLRRAWKANCDIQLIVTGDTSAILDYVVGYICKEGDASNDYKKMFKKLVLDNAQLDNGADTSSILRKTFMTQLGHRDRPAQEVLFTVAGNKFFRFSCQQGAKISLGDLRRVVQKDGRLALNVVDRYARSRVGEKGQTLYIYAMQSDPGKYVQLNGYLPATWPLKEDYCMQVLMLHHAWSVHPKDVLRHSIPGLPPFESYREKFLGDFLYSSACPHIIYQDVQHCKRTSDNPSLRRRKYFSVEKAGKGRPASFLSAYGYIDWNADLSSDMMGTLSYRRAPPGYDWSAAGQWSEGQLDIAHLCSIARFAEAPKTEQLSKLCDMGVYDTRLLDNREQCAIVTMVVQHCRTRLADSRTPKLKLVIDGGGGSGKSHVLQLIHICLKILLRDETCMLQLAPTGSAASLIRGQTIHSGAGIKINSEFVSGNREASLRESFSRCRYLILDERSMVDQKMFALLEKRVTALTDVVHHDNWGSLWGVILVGDNAQLPPVHGMPLYDTSINASPECMRGLALFREFDTAVFLHKNMRVDSTDADSKVFRGILARMRAGETTEQDIDVLNRRAIGALPPDEYQRFKSEAVQYMVPYNQERLERNLDHIRTAEGPIAEFRSIDTGISQHTHSSDSPSRFRGLQPVLWLGKGIRVSVTSNLNTAQGVVRGASGTVRLVIYEQGQGPPGLPAMVLVEMDEQVHESLVGCVGSNPVDRNVLPFVPVQFPCNDKCCTRKQIPLETCRAITVHRSQGGTIRDDTVVDIAAKAERRWPGIVYTAVSRFTKLKQFALAKPLTRELLGALRASDQKGRRAEQQRLAKIAEQTVMSHTELFKSKRVYCEVMQVLLQLEQEQTQ